MTEPTADELADELLGLGAATLGESGGQPLASTIGPMWPGARVAGPAYAVECGQDDNLAIHAAVAEAPAGVVLCVGFPEPVDRGCWGEVLATGAQARGIIGLVIDGGVRDCDALEALAFPAFARGLVLRGAAKDVPGTIGGTTTVGGVRIETGDWIVADRDGVVAIARARLDEVRAAGQARVDKENAMFAALKAGDTTVGLLGLDTSAVQRGEP